MGLSFLLKKLCHRTTKELHFCYQDSIMILIVMRHYSGFYHSIIGSHTGLPTNIFALGQCCKLLYAASSIIIENVFCAAAETYSVRS